MRSIKRRQEWCGSLTECNRTYLESLEERDAALVVVVEPVRWNRRLSDETLSQGRKDFAGPGRVTRRTEPTYLEKMASNRAGTKRPSVSYVAVSEPCLARWMFLMLTGKSGCGIHDSEVNHEKEGEMMLWAISEAGVSFFGGASSRHKEKGKDRKERTDQTARMHHGKA